jgi:hypothetical protein
MKYTGTIIGLRSQYGSIYHVTIDDTKCYLWKASVVGEFRERDLFIRFNWNGHFHEFVLSEIKTNYYSGDLLWDKEFGGKVYL